MPTITERDETAEVTQHDYRYTRVVETAGRVVRVRVRRDNYPHQSFAVAEVLADDMTWTHLAAEAPNNWVHTTPRPTPMIHAATQLGEIAEHLVNRAAEILVPPPTTTVISPHVRNAVAALLTTTPGYIGEFRVTPEDIEWATTHGATLHIIEHDDGSVTFTKEHRDGCPFITTAGTRDCDDGCHFVHPADTDRRLRQ
jgi:hypothetical protein